MSVEIAWKQNILVTDFHLLKSLVVVFGFGSQAFICGFSRQNINSVDHQTAGPSYCCPIVPPYHIEDCRIYKPLSILGMGWTISLVPIHSGATEVGIG